MPNLPVPRSLYGRVRYPCPNRLRRENKFSRKATENWRNYSMNEQSETCDKLLTVSEVADMLQCSERHVYRLEEKGLMPKAVRPGALVRWQRERIAAWIDAGCQPTL